jgi:hypothetical protein
MVRRNVRPGHARVERSGRVTIVWVKPPYPALREAVLGRDAGAEP